MGDALDKWDITSQRTDEDVKKFYRAAPGGIPTTIAFSQSMLVARRWILTVQMAVFAISRMLIQQGWRAWQCCMATLRWMAVLLKRQV